MWIFGWLVALVILVYFYRENAKRERELKRLRAKLDDLIQNQ